VGPLNGFEFSAFADSAYNDSLIIRNYGTAFSKEVYVKFVPATAGSYNRNIPVTGGGVAPAHVAAKAVAVNSSPSLSANITLISCANNKDGANRSNNQRGNSAVHLQLDGFRCKQVFNARPQRLISFNIYGRG